LEDTFVSDAPPVANEIVVAAKRAMIGVAYVRIFMDCSIVMIEVRFDAR
jgi:hypothetical protein